MTEEEAVIRYHARSEAEKDEKTLDGMCSKGEFRSVECCNFRSVLGKECGVRSGEGGNGHFNHHSKTVVEIQFALIRSILALRSLSSSIKEGSIEKQTRTLSKILKKTDKHFPFMVYQPKLSF
ncbi:hypothetical protein L596_012050 [Steinernema carpocapsae]|uniref:Uncharacterized protein n=1 Tax=Steinernema carpocapsae TaxID=34508 RepID=A0A4U5NWJ2_STECR|nr:hypothetical protein L596_012050 [Steinernema carpocapsae]